MHEQENIRIIKKYGNRRLYDTEDSRYIKLLDLYQMIKDEIDFQVIDETNQQDITQTILLQILFELETKERDVLPADLLRSLLEFYRDPTHAQVGRYLAHCLSLYREHQIQIKSPVNSILPVKQQKSHLHDAAEKAARSWVEEVD